MQWLHSLFICLILVNRKKWLTSLTKLNILNALIELDKANPRALEIYNYFPEKAGRRFT